MSSWVGGYAICWCEKLCGGENRYGALDEIYFLELQTDTSLQDIFRLDELVDSLKHLQAA